MQGGTQPRLVMRRGPQPDRTFPIVKDVTTIGRDAANDIVIADPEVSRQHARLVRQPNGGIVMEDLGSTNGTTVNGMRLSAPQLLNAGDTIGLGETVTLGYQVTTGLSGETIVGSGAVRPVEPPQAVPEPRAAPAAPPPPPPPMPRDYVQPTWEPAPPPPARPPAPAAWEAAPPHVAPQYVEPAEPAPPRNNTTRNILMGCGCLLLACVLCAAAVYAFDYLNLYHYLCQPTGLFCP